jgi:hypothetical protein
MGSALGLLLEKSNQLSLAQPALGMKNDTELPGGSALIGVPTLLRQGRSKLFGADESCLERHVSDEEFFLVGFGHNLRS